MAWKSLLGGAGLLVLLSCVLLSFHLNSPKVLMEDDGLDAHAIEMDHNAMLASNPRKNAAFLKVFGRFAQSQLQEPDGATQLAETSNKVAPSRRHHSHSHLALKRLNSKLAKEMQDQLTSLSGNLKTVQTPKVQPAVQVETKENAKEAKVSAAALDALNMVKSGHHHILPRKLRAEFIMDHGRKVLGKHYPALSIKHQSSRRTRTNKDVSLAGKADDALLSAELKTRTTNAAELVKEAALKQMQQMQANAPAPVMQLAQKPAAPYGAQFYRRPAYPTQGQLYSYPQNAYRPMYGYPSAPVAQAPYGYSMPPPQQTLYQPAVAQQSYYAQQPMQTYYNPPQPAYQPQALSAVPTPRAAPQPQASAAVPVSWRAPDMGKNLKASQLTPAQKRAMRSQMLALRSQILSDYKKNTRIANTALLLGPS